MTYDCWGEAKPYIWSLKTNRSVQIEGQSRKSIMLNHQQVWQQPPYILFENKKVAYIGATHISLDIPIIGKLLEHWNPTDPPSCFTQEPSWAIQPSLLGDQGTFKRALHQATMEVAATTPAAARDATSSSWTPKVLRHAIRHCTVQSLSEII